VEIGISPRKYLAETRKELKSSGLKQRRREKMLSLLMLSVCYLESHPVGNDSEIHKENARDAAMAMQHKVQTGKKDFQWLALNRSPLAKHTHTHEQLKNILH